jgi:hypothetical protein
MSRATKDKSFINLDLAYSIKTGTGYDFMEENISVFGASNFSSIFMSMNIQVITTQYVLFSYYGSAILFQSIVLKLSDSVCLEVKGWVGIRN